MNGLVKFDPDGYVRMERPIKKNRPECEITGAHHNDLTVTDRMKVYVCLTSGKQNVMDRTIVSADICGSGQRNWRS